MDPMKPTMCWRDGTNNEAEFTSSSQTVDKLLRFHSASILGCLHRTMAIREWAKLKDEGTTSLERALTAFDMFVLSDRQGDFDYVGRKKPCWALRAS